MEAIHHHAMVEEEAEVPQLVKKGSRMKSLDHPAVDVVARTSSSSSSDSKTSSESNSSGVEDVASDVAQNVNGISTHGTNIGDVSTAVHNSNTQNDGNMEERIVSELKAPILGQVSTNGDEKVTEGVITKGNDLVLGENDEEVIELEFEKAVEKAHTHTAYCPNCSSQITRVVLRRKISRVPSQVQPSATAPNRELFGCLSCFSFFIPSGNRLNHTSIFGGNDEVERPQPVREKLESGVAVVDPSRSILENPTKEHVKPGRVFNLWGIFGGTGGKINTGNEQGNLHQPHYRPNDVTSDIVDQFPKTRHIPGTSPPLSVGQDSVAIDIKGGKGPCEESPGQIGIEEHGQDVANAGRQDVAQGFESVEILKCIVYGGLLESITSLGVVSSAASSGATKLNIIALCLANVISGLFIIGPNLMDLKSETEQHGRSRYHESLGRREHFLLHATLAIISFLVFGLVPPVMFAFTELWEVGAASFACIIILAIAKAYVTRCEKFSEYIKTLLYYVTMGIAVSGIAYVVGDQVKILIEKYGWFETSPAGPSFVPDMSFATRAWSSY